MSSAFDRYIKGTVFDQTMIDVPGLDDSPVIPEKDKVLSGPDEIRNRWERHDTTEDTEKQHALISDTFKLIAAIINDTVPDGRAKELSITRLQEASMWANFAIAEQVPLSENPPE